MEEEYYNPEPTPSPVYTNNSGQINQVYNREVPVGAKIISVYYYLQAAAALVILILIILNMVKNAPGRISILPLIILTLFSLGLMVLCILIGEGLWTRKSWARITAAVFAIIMLVMYIFAIIMGSYIFAIVGIASLEMLKSLVTIILVIGINAAIASYLLFNKRINECYRRDIPVPVQMLSVWSYIGCFLYLLLGLTGLVGGGIVSGLVLGLGEAGPIFTIVSVVLILIGVLNFFVGRGLWKAQNWARIVTAVFAIIGLGGGIYSTVTGLGSAFAGYLVIVGVAVIILNGLIAGYLLFNKKVKEAFKKS